MRWLVIAALGVVLLGGCSGMGQGGGGGGEQSSPMPSISPVGMTPLP
ncbi:MAG TPA: hypothetical protein V6D47_12395 [Oscillatoriaceae cyanobacterium]